MTPYVVPPVRAAKGTLTVTESEVQPPPTITLPAGQVAVDDPTWHAAPPFAHIGPAGPLTEPTVATPGGPWSPGLPAGPCRPRGSWPGLKSCVSSEWLITCRVPTLFEGSSVVAAYDE